eukprot:COSAG01_NODE_13707_length_1545_cov_3.138313_2_plen_155_part_00
MAMPSAPPASPRLEVEQPQHAGLLFAQRTASLVRSQSQGQRVIRAEVSEEQRARLHGSFGAEQLAAVEAEARVLFAQVDTQRDGQLDQAEFSRVLGVLGAMSAPGTGGLGDYMFKAGECSGIPCAHRLLQRGGSCCAAVPSLVCIGHAGLALVS